MTYASNDICFKFDTNICFLLVSFDRTMEEDTMGVSHELLVCHVISLLSVSTLWRL